MTLLPPAETPDRGLHPEADFNPFASAVPLKFRPSRVVEAPAVVLQKIAADYPARVEELRALSVAYRRDPTLESSRKYILVLEALVSTALRREVFAAGSPVEAA